MNKNTFEALLARVNPIVKHYRTDLDHDKATIEANPGVPFLHFTRPTGTDLVLLLPADDPSFPPEGQLVPYLFGEVGRRELSEIPLRSAEYWARPGRECVAWHWFDGQLVQEITPDGAVQIAEQYRRRIQGEWKKHETLSCCR